MKKVLPLLLIFFVFAGFGQERKYITVHRTQKLMGSRFDITVVAMNEEIGYINIDQAIAEITRIEKLISSWDPESETSLVNRNAGIKPVKVSLELFKLIERAKQISILTDGAFDISYASMDEVWKFDGSMRYKPTQKEVRESITKIGSERIILDKEKNTVFLKDVGMKISFGGIGKGYAADKAKKLLVSKQVIAGIINASGDLTTWGTKASGEKWLIGIANPLSKDRIFSWLPVIESSVATSGNYEKYVIINGKRYSHIIDPRTGYPSQGINSVSIFAKDAELCDALATAVYIMGKEAGLGLINQLPEAEVIIVDSKNKIHKSRGILFDNNP
ncbi:FAD:protein FMN transferase [Maribacter sp. HTCC2170]|uniref:FAD:protein FMN transferase n=1 Tax=Maribacter sp. (strain HTCC2170 / KCCM 42371) TaxID=313603 RepID=UPI00006BE07F|nr:FAD:protein FMN transferase [Maribacter sp. HTCC2170]EAQ99968.1 Membrane-associated lipoprotein involved in thiamine biosynthesis [Maribacter sp. HTCC2170]